MLESHERLNSRLGELKETILKSEQISIRNLSEPGICLKLSLIVIGAKSWRVLLLEVNVGSDNPSVQVLSWSEVVSQPRLFTSHLVCFLT